MLKYFEVTCSFFSCPTTAKQALRFSLSGSGFTVKVVTSDNYVKRDSGLVLWDIAVGEGDCPKAGQQVSLCFTYF